MATREASILNYLQYTKNLYLFHLLLAATFTWVTYAQSVNLQVRLVGSQTKWEGLVEVFYQGTWGAVCDDFWDEKDGGVVCRQLGYDSVVSVSGSGQTFGFSDKPIIMDNVRCIGTENNLGQCDALYGVNAHDCSQLENAVVICQPKATSTTVRLSDGGASWRGNVEVYYENEWGLVCDDLWDLNDGQVVCRQLGFAGVSEVYDGAKFGWVASYPLLFDAGCTGAESRLQDCPGTWGAFKKICSPSEAAGVACIAESGAPDIKLVGGAYPNQGRVEIFLWEQWGTVCDTAWGIESANVVCRQLGYESAVQLIPADTFGDGEGTILLDDVRCSGDEISIYFCDHDGINQKSYDCVYSGRTVEVLCRSDEYPNYVVTTTESTPSNGELSTMWKAIIGIAVPIAILLCCCWCCKAVCKDDESNQQTVISNAAPAEGNTSSQYTSVPTAPPPAEMPSAVNQSSVAYPIGVAPPPASYPSSTAYPPSAGQPPGGIPPSAAFPPSAVAPPSAPYPPAAYQYQPATAPSAPDLPPGYDSVIKDPDKYSYGPSSADKSAAVSGTAPDAPPYYSQPAVVFNPDTDTVNVTTSYSTNA